MTVSLSGRGDAHDANRVTDQPGGAMLAPRGRGALHVPLESISDDPLAVLQDFGIPERVGPCPDLWQLAASGILH